MLLFNFAHPLTPDQMRRLLDIMEQADITVHDVPIQIDNQAPLLPQVVAAVDRCPISKVGWQTMPILVNPPGYAPVTGTLLAELHGRMGHFPAIIRMRPVAGHTPPLFEVVEILNLQAVRDAARERR